MRLIESFDRGLESELKTLLGPMFSGTPCTLRTGLFCIPEKSIKKKIIYF